MSRSRNKFLVCMLHEFWVVITFEAYTGDVVGFIYIYIFSHALTDKRTSGYIKSNTHKSLDTSGFDWQILKLQGLPWRFCIWLFRLRHRKGRETHRHKLGDQNSEIKALQKISMGYVGNLQSAVTGLKVLGAYGNCLIFCIVFKAGSLLHHKSVSHCCFNVDSYF